MKRVMIASLSIAVLGLLSLSTAPKAATGWIEAVPGSDSGGTIIRSAGREATEALGRREEAGNSFAHVAERYCAEVDGGGLTFMAGDIRFRTGLIQVELDGVVIPADAGKGIRPSADCAQILRPGVVEEYRFEAGRVEQLFILDGVDRADTLRLRVKAETALVGREHPKAADGDPSGASWQGGLWFGDAADPMRLAYHTAIAIDAGGRRTPFEPALDGRDIVLEVPPAFLADASFPLTVDPWIELGGSATGTGISGGSTRRPMNPSLAVNSLGHPGVAWNQGIGGGLYRIYYREWTGSAWIGRGGSDSGDGVNAPIASGEAWTPSLAFDSQDRPVIAYEEYRPGSGTEIKVRRWTGTAWTGFGGSDGPGGISNSPMAGSADPQLRLRAGDLPMVAWTEQVGFVTQVYFRWWDGGSWLELSGSASGGGVSNTVTQALSPSLVWSEPFGAPAIAWQEYASSFQESDIRLRYWSGSWLELSGSASGGGISNTVGMDDYHPSLQVGRDGLPWVAWHCDLGTGSFGLYVRTWNGAWSELGGSATGSGISGPYEVYNVPSLAMAHLGGRDLPVVASGGRVGMATGEIHLTFWNPWSGTWDELGGSMSAGGMSGANGQDSVGPSLAVDSLGRPVAAWEELNWVGSGDVHVRAWR